MNNESLLFQGLLGFHRKRTREICERFGPFTEPVSVTFETDWVKLPGHLCSVRIGEMAVHYSFKLRLTGSHPEVFTRHLIPRPHDRLPRWKAKFTGVGIFHRVLAVDLIAAYNITRIYSNPLISAPGAIGLQYEHDNGCTISILPGAGTTAMSVDFAFIPYCECIGIKCLLDQVAHTAEYHFGVIDDTVPKVVRFPPDFTAPDPSTNPFELHKTVLEFVRRAVHRT